MRNIHMPPDMLPGLHGGVDKVPGIRFPEGEPAAVGGAVDDAVAEGIVSVDPRVRLTGDKIHNPQICVALRKVPGGGDKEEQQEQGEDKKEEQDVGQVSQ